MGCFIALVPRVILWHFSFHFKMGVNLTSLIIIQKTNNSILSPLETPHTFSNILMIWSFNYLFFIAVVYFSIKLPFCVGYPLLYYSSHIWLSQSPGKSWKSEKSPWKSWKVLKFYKNFVATLLLPLVRYCHSFKLGLLGFLLCMWYSLRSGLNYTTSSATLN